MKNSHETVRLSAPAYIALAGLGLSLGAACGSQSSVDSAPSPPGDQPTMPEVSDDTPETSAPPAPPPGDGEQLLPDGDLEPPPAEPEMLDPDNACEAVTSEGEQQLRPMDVVVVIDNSGSMQEEIASVERNINVNFASILDESEIDYRVVMLTGYRGAEPVPDDGTDNFNSGWRVCVEPPLGPSECDGRAAGVSPHTPDRFVHFDQPVGSRDAACVMLQTLKSPPFQTKPFVEGGQAPSIGTDDPLLQGGWTAQLRPEAFKAFIAITDDTLDCELGDLNFLSMDVDDAVAKFDESLRTAAPEQFGALDMDRTYSWHSIVGLEPKADPQAVYETGDEIVSGQCATAVNSGEPHQALSRLTDGLRYPVCDVDGYDAIFRRIATEIVEGAALPCSWEIPDPPDGQTFDKDRVNLAYEPGDGAPAPDLVRVATQAACADSLGWYYDDPEAPTTVNACPATCELFGENLSGQVDLLFGCASKAPEIK